MLALASSGTLSSVVLTGIGWTMFSISTISCIYYNMLVAYAFFYTFASFARDVPWRTCDNAWNTPGMTPMALVLAGII